MVGLNAEKVRNDFRHKIKLFLILTTVLLLLKTNQREESGLEPWILVSALRFCNPPDHLPVVVFHSIKSKSVSKHNPGSDYIINTMS